MEANFDLSSPVFAGGGGLFQIHRRRFSSREGEFPQLPPSPVLVTERGGFYSSALPLKNPGFLGKTMRISGDGDDVRGKYVWVLGSLVLDVKWFKVGEISMSRWNLSGVKTTRAPMKGMASWSSSGELETEVIELRRIATRVAGSERRAPRV
ncbi:hypothetical protein Rs2_16491 [Raphanus sativus]|nr:hypothetical protein Rs2_30933 [Raphanus sativus]KAJ4902540.1 hypothetical protein Rs2_16491 [Raphanus sativus]